MSTSLTEKEYRNLERDSYSSLSLFANDRKAYYRKYIRKEIVDTKESPQLIYGSLVDCLLFSPLEFDNRFIVGDFDIPTAQLKAFTENLVKRVYENEKLDESRKEKDFKTLMLWAYNDTKYDENGNEVAFRQKYMTLDIVIEKFNKECTRYYDYLIDTQIAGKSLITQENYSKARLAVDKLRYSTVTGPIILQENNFDIEVQKQLIILFDHNGLPLKSMLDLVHIDHSKKIIYPYDLKTTHNAEEFSHSYLKFNYYIQAGVYHLALKHWVIQRGYQDYTINPIKFIVIDSYNYMAPLIYTTNSINLLESLTGFYLGKRYRGVSELISDLQWHKENDIWDISKVNYCNNGNVNLAPFNDNNWEESEGEDQS